MQTIFITTALGTEDVLAQELRAMDPDCAPRIERAGVGLQCVLPFAYRICLWSRVASRVLLPLATFDAANEDALYNGVRAVNWGDHLTPRQTLAVHGVTSRSALTNSKYIALKTKDAVVDAIRERTGQRPDIDTEAPDILLNLRLHEDKATLSLDLSGQALHRRGLGRRNTEAPLKENLAAALLLMAGWPDLAARGAPLVNPMCGSGTLLAEAALMAMDIAPGLRRQRHGFHGWLGHDRAAWQDLWDEAQERRARGLENPPSVHGFDQSPAAVNTARRNMSQAGLDRAVHVSCKALGDFEAPRSPLTDAPRGLIIANPPYGARLGEAGELGPLYARLGDTLKHRFPGWTGAVLTGNRALAGHIGLKPSQRHRVFNGPIECRLLVFPLRDDAPASDQKPRWRKPGPDGEMLVNRLRKNHRRLTRWASRHGVQCYRVYDADIPEYNLAIDWYDGAALIHEYQRPPKIDPAVADQHLRDATLIVPEVFGISDEATFLKVRRRHKPHEQYDKLADLGTFRQVREADLTFLVNLSDYLDTGLFLDQRLLRAMIRDLAQGRDFLNLFAYTCTATVYAAAGGATSTTSVDLSHTYLDWGKRNLRTNGFDDERRHLLVREDCGTWLHRNRRRYGLIYAAPPTFSRSSQADTFDLQRDHVPMLRACVRNLTPDGVLLFSNPSKSFQLDHDALSDLKVEEITARILPEDFARNPTFTAWQITR